MSRVVIRMIVCLAVVAAAIVALLGALHRGDHPPRAFDVTPPNDEGEK